MKIYSEKTGKQYSSVDECLKAEADYEKEMTKKKEEQAKLAENRKIRAKEVEEAFNKIKEAEKQYIKLRNQFIEDYGSYHMTFSNTNSSNDTFFDTFSNFFNI